MLSLAARFVRPRILVTCSLIVLLGSLAGGSVSYQTFLAIIILVTFYIHAASLNDYADRQIDEINLPGAKDRPLVTRSMPQKTLWRIHYAAGITTLILSMFYGMPAVVMTIAILAFDYAYSLKPLRITDRGALAQFTLPFAYVIYPFSLGYWSLDAAGTFPILLVAGLYSGFIARLFLKDFRDVKGDSQFGKRTFLIRHGVGATCFASWLFGFIALMLLALATKFAPATLIVLALGHIVTILLLIQLSNTGALQSQLRLISGLAKIGNISVLAILLHYFSLNYLNYSSSLTFL